MTFQDQRTRKVDIYPLIDDLTYQFVGWAAYWGRRQQRRCFNKLGNAIGWTNARFGQAEVELHFAGARQWNRRHECQN